ncbi:hypothetical protein BFR40_02885 [Brochothrix thermosphacta]|uniref:hypothetical protein n=1 Tax=Brochothrix thermosphacta TaxID=2756 RepID=UPI00083F987A|nr:hypothetical protein [Brochothrix thermosphacta]ODJ53577.1 hypothetical protein BFR40_02885 [Brochothrix thermosphacta]
MNNNEEYDRLINSLMHQKNKEKKYLLKIEIAKATDRSVKKALQEILKDIQKRERRNLVLAIITLIVIVFVFLYILGKGTNLFTYDKTSGISSEKNPISDTGNDQNDNNAGNQSDDQESNQITTTSSSLSEEQVKNWVKAVWEKRYNGDIFYDLFRFDVTLNKNDNLVYVTIKAPKDNDESNVVFDSYGEFRINESGHLEESGRFVDSSEYESWSLVSSEFMDVSNVETRFLNYQAVNTKDLNSIQAITWAKNSMFNYLRYPRTDILFYTELSEERMLEITSYEWDTSHEDKKIIQVFRVNADGYLETKSLSENKWDIINKEYLYTRDVR